MESKERQATICFDPDMDTIPIQEVKVPVSLDKGLIMPSVVPTLEQELVFDSLEEQQFSWWMDELIEVGMIERYIHHPESILLSEAKQYHIAVPRKKTLAKIEPRELIKSHNYTSDFLIYWSDEAINILVNDKDSIIENKSIPFLANSYFEGLYSIVEVKPDFDQNNMTRLFTINQKWVLEKYNVYIELCKLPSLFKKTFTPKKYLLTEKKQQLRKLKYVPVDINTYLKSLGYGR